MCVLASHRDSARAHVHVRDVHPARETIRRVHFRVYADGVAMSHVIPIARMKIRAETRDDSGIDVRMLMALREMGRDKLGPRVVYRLARNTCHTDFSRLDDDTDYLSHLRVHLFTRLRDMSDGSALSIDTSRHRHGWSPMHVDTREQPLAASANYTFDICIA